LLVDDDIADRRLAEQLLAKCPQPVEFTVDSVGRLSEAIECLGNAEYDIVLLDLGLPDSRGIGAVRKISEVDPHIPIVVLTGLDDDETGLLAVKNGAADYLVKGQPLENILVRTIRYAIERKQTEKGLKALAEELKRNNHELQISKASFHNVVQRDQDGILVVDREGIVVFANPAAEAIFGRSQDELLGESIGLPLANRTTEIGIIRKAGQTGIGDMRTVETEWRQKDAHLIMITDITKRKLAEENLRKANEKLREYNQLKDEFISTASHELRTPLSIIMGAIRLVLDEIPGKIVEEQRDVLATAMESVKRLSRLVNSLLNISKIESGILELQKTVVNICELIKDTVSDYKNLARQKALSLDCEVPEYSVDICLDPDKTREVLINLISNSIKFTPEGGWVKVSCTKQDGEVLVSVQDSGVGIAKEDIPKLFDKFTQFGRKTHPGEEGTGLGLAIAKKLVEMHGGKIEVESEVNHGTTFIISLPLTADATTEGLLAETDELVENALANNKTHTRYGGRDA